MKVRIFKNINHSLVIEEADLLQIFEFLRGKYKKAEIVGICIDGTRIESDNINDILKFNNPNYRKIKAIEINVGDAYDERISLKLGDSDVEFTVSSQNDETARDRAQELLKMLFGMKPYYDLLARISVFGFLIVLWAAISIPFTAGQLFGLLPKSGTKLSALEVLNYTVIILFTIFIITYPIDRFRSWMFPKIFFNLGNQKREMTRIKQWRSIIFKTILLGIIIGIIVYFITMSLL